MQSGEIKHWNQSQGYGFIDVNNQPEDVFFHISKVRLSQPITVGQRVYFNSERNAKNQLQATEVTSIALSIAESSASDSTNHSLKRNSKKANANRHHNTNNNRANPNKKSKLSTLFSLIAIIAVAVIYFGFSAVQPESVLEDVASNNSSSSTSTVAPATASNAITGDKQIDNTIALIQQGGPYPYPDKDGSTFGNRENRLPAEARGYYREYTVPTPGVSHRGARRIVTGGNPPTVYYLTLDHYDSFSQLEVN
ncbi:cold shock domain-containing protein [Psychrobacter sp. TAE2020]|uniref:ribonuclease domain-containing protein n=1 Tax=Psychrobacter sp. TAE2020 TaxID=2846762 RepID=UPI001C114C15|nr:ribonuclease domain-containing protein [Psychrobacter sp. TAE2020]MBU5616770.1 cold shock domain-containing protein [Psychrobacter sp. TAE2020]